MKKLLLPLAATLSIGGSAIAEPIRINWLANEPLVEVTEEEVVEETTTV